MDTIISPLKTDTPSITEEAICRWLGGAFPGDRLEYHLGFLAIDIDPSATRLTSKARAELARVARRAAWAAENHLAHLVQRRRGLGDYAYILIARPRQRPARADPLVLGGAEPSNTVGVS